MSSRMEFGTLLEMLQRRARDVGDRRALTFLVDGEKQEEQITYGELDRRARSVAARLQGVVGPGARALLLYPPGLDYVIGFLGCLYAGVVAVPAYPPDPARLNRTLPRLQAIANDAQAEVVLTTGALLAMAEFMFAQAPDLAALRWMASDAASPGAEEEWKSPNVGRETLAFLQYTSGSTGSPKGVMLTHGNLLANEELIERAFAHDESTSVVGWLPLYHDMGLIGNLIQPMYVGIPCVLMSPIAFLQRPLRWLQAISRYRATTSGGPNFAYDLCVRKVSEAERDALDLSSWRVAFNGAEPIRRGTLDRFTEYFAASGFRRSAFYPCYGLAEATLIVSGGEAGAEPVTLECDRAELARGRAKPGEGVELVGSGKALGESHVRVVEPETCGGVEEGTIGEIWVRGASVASGYWRKKEETAEVFGARLSNGEGPYLRTGDLGFVREGELYITGRRKDLIILRGRNVYPQDLEQTVEGLHPALRPGCGAAFSVETDGEEKVVVVHELDRRILRGTDEADPERVLVEIVQSLVEQHDVQASAVVLLKPGTIPKTSSGKIQRRETRAQFLAGQLESVATWTAMRTSVAAAISAREKETQPPSQLTQIVATALGVATAELDVARPLSSYGMDSLAAVELQHAIATELGRKLSLEALLAGPTLGELAAAVEAAPRHEGAIPAGSENERARSPMSVGQEALWFIQRLAPESSAYHIAGAAEIHSEVDGAALGRAVMRLIERHAILRTTFHEGANGPEQVVGAPSQTAFQRVGAALSVDERARRMSEEVERPFDLATGPLLRVRLFESVGSRPVLLLVVHHIITDFWSLGLFVEQLGLLYRAEIDGVSAVPISLRIEYADYARWQRNLLSSGTLDGDWAYWRAQLEGELPLLELPSDRPRPPVQSYRGASVSLRIPDGLTRDLRALSNEQCSTLYVTLLSAYAALLQRYSRQEEVVIGVPSAGRTQPELDSVLGYFVNMLPLRVGSTPDERWTGAIGRVRDQLRGALAHQSIPFVRLAAELGGARDASRSPLLQTVFLLQQARDEHDLAALALGDAGARLVVGALELHSVSLEQRSAQFDLSVMLAPQGETLVGSFQYNSDLFDAETIERLAKHYVHVLREMVARPEALVRELELLSPEENEQLEEWNDTARAYRKDVRIPKLFEEQAARTPEAVALQDDEKQLTYRELDERSNQLARYLQKRGVGPEVLVAICVERSVEMVVGLLGILKAGGAYVPLDPAYPKERLEYMLADSGAAVLVTQESLRAELPSHRAEVVWLDLNREQIAREEKTPGKRGVRAENLAYVIYTSGSTGKPKGTLVGHDALLNLCAWHVRAFAVTASDRATQIASTAFDASVWEIWPYLVAGASVHMAPEPARYDASELRDWLVEEGITIGFVPTPMLERMLPLPWPTTVALRMLLTGGDRLTRGAEGLPFSLVNDYGPTENAVVSTWGLVDTGGERAPHIGRFVDNVTGYVLDAAGRLAMIGVCGELHLSGASLARGYLGRAELTADRFVPNPFAAPGKRMYRTGDLTRWRRDGNLEYLGRIDHQVKIRGFRIELGEIEAALREEGVRDVEVLAREDVSGQKRLVAYVTGHVEAAALKAALGVKLPEYMVPSAFVVLDELPLTPSGKIDRKALPAPEYGGDAAAYVAPATPTEELLVGVWAEVLRVGRVGVEDGFFELGGHSLVATQLMSRVRKAFEVELPLKTIFDAPTVRALAARVDAAKSSGEGRVVAPPLLRRERGTQLELSYAQERLWFIDQLEPGSNTYNLFVAMRLTGALDVSALSRALDEVVRRHEALRTRFETHEGHVRQVIEPVLTLSLPVEDLGDLPSEAREIETRARARVESERPFALDRGPLIRARLLRLASDEHVVLLTMHHIISDGWSIGVFVEELTRLYRAFHSGEASPLAELTLQYADYAAWQRDWLSGGELERQLAYWRTQLSGLAPVIALPTDRPRPAVQRHVGRSSSFVVSPELTEGLLKLSRKRECSLFMTLLGAFQILLARYSDQTDIAVGVPIASRTHGEIETLIGLFVNTLVMRTNVDSSATFEELMRDVRRTTLEAYAHQDVPFEKVVTALSPERSMSHAPLFQVMLILQNTPANRFVLPELVVETIDTERESSKFDLTMSMTETDGALVGELEYDSDLFDAKTVERLLMSFELLLRGIVDGPTQTVGELPLLPAAEQHQQLVLWNDTVRAYRNDVLIHELFEEQVARTPQAVALQHGEERLTYRSLDERANQLARYLEKRGVGPDVLVAICVERSVEMVVGLLGILKAGGAYVPLDPAYPKERLEYMLADSGATVLVTQESLRAELPARGAEVVCLDVSREQIAREEKTRGKRGARATNLAYVIYTSGSTGKPKGVAITHRNAATLLQWAAEVYGESELGGVLFGTSICFDLSVWEMFVPLTRGGRVIVASNALEVRTLTGREDVTLVNTVPSVMTELVRTNELPRSVKTVNLAGEPLTTELVKKLYETGHVERVYDLYGPTEDTTYSTYTLRQEAGRPTIGRPLSETKAYVLDSGWRLSPAGVGGELHLAGAGLARGYLGKPELTAEKFIPNPFGGPGGRMYRTGDLARWRPTGELEYAGRADHQVKIRGFRIELGEIEAALREEGVRDVVVLAREDEPGRKRLVAYVAGDATVDALKAAMSVKLPEYMVPSAFVVLDNLPLTPSGKIDRKALPAPERRDEAAYEAPRNEVEERLAAIWKDVLRLERVGVRDNFFELGGDSILSIQIVSRARAAGLHMTPRQLFERPTIEALAKDVGRGGAIQAEQGLVVGQVELLPIERWFFEHGEEEEPSHYNQAVLLEVRGELDENALGKAVAALVWQHDALRSRYRRVDGEWKKELREEVESIAVERIDLSSKPEAVEAEATKLQRSLDLAKGPLMRVAVYELGARGKRLLLVIHHVAVDGVSWRVLLGDLEAGYRQAQAGKEVKLGAKTTSLKAWAERMRAWAKGEAEGELAYWRGQGKESGRLPRRVGANVTKDVASATAKLSQKETEALLREVPAVYRTQVNDALLLAVAEGLEGWMGATKWVVALEGHGREALFGDIDLSRTVGWFTSLYPVQIDVSASGVGKRLKAVKETLRGVPNRGLGYGALKYLGRDEVRAELVAQGAPEVSFNYLGQLDQALAKDSLFEGAKESSGAAHSEKRLRDHLLEINAQVSGGRLQITFGYSKVLQEKEAVEQLAQRVAESLRAVIEHCRKPEAGGYTPSDFALAKVGQEWLDREVGRGTEVEDVYAVSPMQEGMLFVAMLEPESETYFEQVSVRLEGKVDEAALERAWREVVQRHEILRTSFRWEGLERPVQLVHREVKLEVERRRLSGNELKEWKAADRKRGFALKEAPLMRVALLEVGEEQHELVWSFHHVLLDGWSLPMVMKEVLSAYDGKSVGPAPLKYREYIAWLTKQDERTAEKYFRKLLSGFEAPTSLGVAQGRVGAQPQRVEERTARLTSIETQRLKNAASKLGVTVNTVVQGAWALLLARYSGTTDVVFGAVGAGRPAELPGAEQMVGLFINTLPVRVRVSADETVSSMLSALQAQQLETRRYEASPLNKVQTWSEVPRGQPLFESMLVFDNYPLGDVLQEREGSAARFRIAEVEVVEQTNYALWMAAMPGAELTLRLQYDAERFDAAAIDRLMGHYLRLLGELANPDEIALRVPMLSRAEEQQLVEWNETARAYPKDKRLEQRFEEQAAKTPKVVAVQQGEKQLTYRELDERSNQLARSLQKRGVGPEVLVGLCVERSVEMVVGMLGILKAGGAYVPLDPAYPKERLGYMLADSGASVLVTQGSLRSELPTVGVEVVCLDEGWAQIEVEPKSPCAHRGQAENPAYVIYTSGSTGKPKGVVGTHRGALNRLEWAWRTSPYEAGERCCQKTALSFVDSIAEVFGPLLQGVELVIVSNDAVRDVARFVETMAEAGITRVVLVPSLLEALLDTHGESLGKKLPRLRRWSVSGEALTLELARRFHQCVPEGTLMNLYGSSEVAADATVEAEAHTWTERATIGRPIDNTQIYVWDGDGRAAPLGVSGELYVGGANLARGYVNRPELTAEKFMPNPFGAPGERVYRTGDLAKWRATGELEYAGRADHQVKIRGFRIELGEIESTLRAQRGVKEVVVVAREDEPGRKRLVAYIAGDAAVDALKQALGAKLPEYMVPSAFVVLDKLPLTPSGKIDRKALPAPEWRGDEAAYEAPRNEVEERLAAIWKEVLRLERVGVRDDFFLLGGDSLVAHRLVARLRGAFGMRIAVAQLLANPTVAGLAAVIATSAPRASEQSETRVAHRPGPLPISATQRATLLLHHYAPIQYNPTHGFLMVGPLDMRALENSLRTLMNRHAALRASFPLVDGETVQVIEQSSDLQLPVTDLTDLPAPERALEAQRLLKEAAELPCDLARGPLVRVAVIKIGESRHWFTATFHHLVYDAWSMAIFLHELELTYSAYKKGNAVTLPELAISYEEAILLKESARRSERFERQREFVLEQVAGDLNRFRLRTDRARPSSRTTPFFASDTHFGWWTREQVQRVDQMSRGLASTRLAAIVLMFEALIFAETGCGDICVGILSGLREPPELEDVIGLFIDELPVRTRLDKSQSVAQALVAVRDSIDAAHDHKDASLVDVLSEEQYVFEPPFQVLVNVVKQPSFTLPEFAIEDVYDGHGRLARVDIVITILELPSGDVSFSWTYRADLFDRKTIERLWDVFMKVSQRVISTPKALEEPLQFLL